MRFPGVVGHKAARSKIRLIMLSTVRKNRYYGEGKIQIIDLRGVAPNAEEAMARASRAALNNI